MVGQTINQTGIRAVMYAVSIAAGLLLIIIGLIQLVEWDYDVPVHFVMSIYYLLFGVLCCTLEFPIQVIGVYLSFLKSYFGKGVFYVFLGTLVFDETVWYTILGSVYLICIGVLCMIFACTLRDKIVDPEDESSGAGSQKEEQPALNQNENPPPNQV